jgi:SUN domain-containing protein 1/2
MSTDNKAYKPSASDLDNSDESFSDDGKTRRRRKKKKEPVGGPLTTLPIVGADKRKKKRARGSRGNAEEMEYEESDEEHVSVSLQPLERDVYLMQKL